MIATFIPPDKLGTPPMSDNPWELLPTASNHAASLDALYVFLTIVSGVAFVLVVGAMFYFMWKYKKRTDNDVTSPLRHSGKIEFAWSAIPAVFLMVFFVWGEIDFVKLNAPPADTYDIHITGQKWSWTIEYPGRPGPASTASSVDDKIQVPVLVVPKGQPVRLLMTSTDVIHSFYIPAFRIKRDVVPGRYTTMWFTAIEEGRFPIFCAEYCGDDHSGMLAIVEVVPPEQYEARVEEVTDAGQGDMSLEEWGEKLFAQNGCNACHQITGAKGVGPGLGGGFFGRDEPLADGSSAVVDENYISESILDPNAKVVNGFAPAMPPFAGRIDDEQMKALIAFIKSLK